MRKQDREAVELLEKSLRIVEKLKTESLSDKRKAKRDDETCEQFDDRMMKIQVDCIKVSLEWLVRK